MKQLEIVLYPEDGWNPQKILDVIAKYKSIKKYVFILHDKDEVDSSEKLKKAHFHVYLYFDQTSVTFEKAAKWFDTKVNNVAKVKGHMIDVIRYYTHEKYPEKHQYSYDEMYSNFDVVKFVAQENEKLSFKEIIKLCADGTITPINYRQYIPPYVYVTHKSQIFDAFDYHDNGKLLDANGERSMETIWLAGPTATGKSTFVKLIANKQDLSFYFTAAGNDPFSKYVNQPIVALDDIRPDEPFSYSELLKLLDPEFISPVHSRYSDVILMCDYIFITSPYLPDEFVKLSSRLNYSDGPEQLYRRISKTIKFSKEELIVCEYDKKRNMYVPCAHAPNPAKDYYKHRVKKMPKPALEIISEVIEDLRPLKDAEVSIDDDIPF